MSPKPPPDTILLVEGEVLVRYAIADYLRACGYRVIEASSGAEALAVLGEKSIAVSILLSSVALPGPLNRV